MSESVIGIVFDSVNLSDVLLVKRRDVPIWVLPGGGVDEGESPEQAVAREILEETGLSVDIVRKSAIYTPLNRLASTTHVFACRAIGGRTSKTDETREIGFFPVGKFPKPFFEVHLDWLQDALNNPEKTIEAPIFQVSYLAVIRYFFRHPLLLFRCFLSKLGLPWNSA